MRDRWTELEAWVDALAPAFASTLRPPAPTSDIETAEAQLGVTFPPSVRQSYRIHDGDTCSWYGVLGYGLLPLSALVEKAETLRAIDGDFDYDFWGDALLPLLDVGNGDYLCVSDAPAGEETPLVHWNHESSARTTLDPSFAAYVDRVLAALKAGDYTYNAEKERLSVDISIRPY